MGFVREDELAALRRHVQRLEKQIADVQEELTHVAAAQRRRPTPAAQTYPAQTYPAQTYPAQTEAAPADAAEPAVPDLAAAEVAATVGRGAGPRGAEEEKEEDHRRPGSLTMDEFTDSPEADARPSRPPDH